MSKQVNYNENLCAGAAIRDDKGRRISKLFEAPHPKMTVGYAKNLIMPDDPTEQEFNFRQSGGGLIEDGVAVIDKVKGNSVVWNQLIKNGNFASTEEWVENGATISISNGEATITQTLEGDYGVGQKVNVIAGHKIMILMDVKEVTSMYVGVFRSQYDSVGFHSASNAKQINSVGFVSFFITIAELGNYKSYFFGFARGGANSSIKVRSVNLTDLTQMFGAGNEPATYEEYLQRKPKVADEYAYNEGTIVNNKVEAIKTSGVNLWDEQWELGAYNASTGEKLASSNQIRSKNMFACLPNTSYYWRIPNKANGTYMGKCLFYDISRAFISSAPVGPSSFLTVTTPSNARFVAFTLREEYGTTYNHDICINLSDPAINGKYFPYEKHELDLSWVKDIKDAEGVKLFEDGMRSAGTAFDEVRKNKAVKRFGVKVFDGTENFGRYQYSDGFWYFRLDATTLEVKISAKYLCNKYFYKGVGTGLLNEDKTIASFYGPALFLIRDDSFESVDSFKQHLADLYAAGTPLVVYYELAEPIEVEYDEKSLTYPVVAGGTEEAIASEPSSAFRADIGYGIDAVKTILDLKARVEALEGK